MRIAVIILAALWGILSVLAFAVTREHTRDARLTAAYILVYPVVAVILFLNDPVPLWLAVPVVFGFIPWLMAGPHLWRSLKDPQSVSADEWMGIPKAYWLWGGAGAVILGIVFN